MTLCDITTFRNERFAPASRPTRQTIHRWIRRGELPVVRIGGKIYVDTDRLAKEHQATGNAKADAVLQKQPAS